MSKLSPTPPSARIRRLERALIKTAIARVGEHIAMHGHNPDMTGHSLKAVAMYEAAKALYKATK